ncbi:MAG: monovalent cation/H(+) antiporter subunit G [Thermodesulfobacteriota bacterium]
MSEIIVSLFLIMGSLFMLLGTIGILRMPDLFMRMSTTTKAATLGTALILSAAAISFSEIAVTSKSIATIVFVLLTAPISAHMIGRASYINRIPLWKNSVVDDLSGHYDLTTHKLESCEEEDTEKDL